MNRGEVRFEPASERRPEASAASAILRLDSDGASRDRYGRILAHAFIKGRQLEIAQPHRNLAYVYRYEGQRFDGLPAFEAAERHARQGGLGVWGRQIHSWLDPDPIEYERTNRLDQPGVAVPITRCPCLPRPLAVNPHDRRSLSSQAAI
jgi:endonuclease YncB( thermonuclease family)